MTKIGPYVDGFHWSWPVKVWLNFDRNNKPPKHYFDFTESIENSKSFHTNNRNISDRHPRILSPKTRINSTVLPLSYGHRYKDLEQKQKHIRKKLSYSKQACLWRQSSIFTFWAENCAFNQTYIDLSNEWTEKNMERFTNLRVILAQGPC